MSIEASIHEPLIFFSSRALTSLTKIEKMKGEKLLYEVLSLITWRSFLSCDKKCH